MNEPPPGPCPYCENGYICPEVKHAGPAVICGQPYFWLFDHGTLRLFPYPEALVNRAAA